MRLALLVLLLVPILLLAQFAKPRSQPPPISPERLKQMRDAVMKPVVYRLPDMDSVKIVKDLRYSVSGELMDVYLPVRKAPAPVLVLVHGGVPPDAPLRPKEWGFYNSWGRLAAAAGFVAVVPNHRLGYPEPHIDEAAADVAAGLDYVQQHARELRADPARMCVAAYSAGGVLLSPFLAQPDPRVKCLLAFYAILDVRGSDVHGRFMNQATLRQYSPAAHLGASAAALPIFVARAGHDQIPGLNAGVQTFVDEALAANVPLTLMVHPNGVHGFDSQNDDDRSREIIRAALEFMKTHLSAGPTDTHH